MRPSLLCTAFLLAVLLAALSAGPPAVAALVIVVCVALLVDVQGLLLRSGVPAVLPASAVLGVGAPLAIALEARLATAGLVAAAFLIVILAVLGGGRRRIAQSLGVTLLAGLLPGLGGVGIVVLSEISPEGLLTLLGALVAAEVAVAGVRRVGWGGQESDVAAVAVAVTLAVALAVVVATSLPLSVAAGLGALALLATLGSLVMRRALAPPPVGFRGMVFAATASVALAAPAALALSGSMPAAS